VGGQAGLEEDRPDATLYWLANRIGRVVATDIYGQGDFAHREAAATMLSDPGALAPYPYREDRLEVREMNALDLPFPTPRATSSTRSPRSSIRRARGDGARCGRALDAFTPHELQRDIIGPSGLELVQPVSYELSPQSFDNVIRWGNDGQISQEMQDSRPHIVLQARSAPWTSVFLALRKPSG
jgi:hypothetical protein